MSKQRSGGQSTSGRSGQSSTVRNPQAAGGGAVRATITEQVTFETEVEPVAPSVGQTTASQSSVGTGQARPVGEQARPVGEQARAVTEQAKDIAEQVQEKATQKVESGLTKGKSQVAESLHALNQSLLISGQQLRDRNQQNVSRYVDQLANKVERAASYLQNTDITEIVDRTEDFARRRPAVFLGGAFVLGLIGARFFKSSQRQGTGPRAQGPGWSGGRYYPESRFAGEARFGRSPEDAEWSALRKAVTRPDLADLPSAGVPTQPLGESGLGRQRAPLDFDDTFSPPDASRR